jgi:hypothetical protein
MDISKGYVIEGKIDDLDAYKVRNQCLTYNGMFVRLEGGDPRKLRPIPIEQGGDGIYTFLFDQNRSLHTAKVSNQFEIGSLHLTLAYEGQVTHVLAAGEFKKTGNRVEYNLLSGTFMKPWMDEMEHEYDDDIQKQAQTLFEDAGMTAVYTDKAFITAKNVPVTKEQLDTYVDAGFEVRLFENRKYCQIEPVLLQVSIESWKGKPGFESAIQKAQDQLEQSKAYTLYTRGGRRMSKKYCKKTTCRKMGFSQKASCRPYKNCYSTRRKRLV